MAKVPDVINKQWLSSLVEQTWTCRWVSSNPTDLSDWQSTMTVEWLQTSWPWTWPAALDCQAQSTWLVKKHWQQWQAPLSQCLCNSFTCSGKHNIAVMQCDVLLLKMDVIPVGKDTCPGLWLAPTGVGQEHSGIRALRDFVVWAGSATLALRLSLNLICRSPC